MADHLDGPRPFGLGTRDRVYKGPWLLTSLFLDRAERFADEPAISTIDQTLSFADVAERAAHVAGGYRSLGLEPGDRVATMLDNSLDYVAAWHGTLWSGSIEVPVNTEYKGVFLEHILRDSGASALVIQERWLGRLAGLELPDLRHVVVVGDPGTDATGDLGAPVPHVAFHRLHDLLDASPRPPVDRLETDIDYVMYTSGTTGPSKGAIHNHRSTVHYLMPFVEGLDLDDDDVCYAMFPLFHQMGRTTTTTAAFWVGNRVELRAGFSTSHFWEDVASCGATWAGYFGAVILFLAQQPPSDHDRAHKLTRAFGSSGSVQLLPAWEERFGVKLFEVYGSTEAGLATGLGSGPPKHGTMGLPCKQVEIAIVDSADNTVPAGTTGELVIRPRVPYAIFQGYLNRPEATLASWRNLWFHTGDAGHLDGEGYFVFEDRNSDVIRRRGENIASFFVEAAVRSDPDVADCAAFGVAADLLDIPGATVPERNSGEQEVMVAVVPRAGSAPDPATLFRSWCDLMPRHAVPRYLRFVETLPKTPTQRTQKHRLRETGITPDTFDREALGIFPTKE